MSATHDDVPGTPVDQHHMGSEQVVWEGTPGHLWKAFHYVACIGMAIALLKGIDILAAEYQAVTAKHKLISFLPILWGMWAYLSVASHNIKLTNQRLEITTGVLSRHSDEIELFRVKDTQVQKPLLYRLFGRGRVVIKSSDKSLPIANIEAVKGAEGIKDQIRDQVHRCRRATGTREID